MNRWRWWTVGGGAAVVIGCDDKPVIPLHDSFPFGGGVVELTDGFSTYEQLADRIVTALNRYEAESGEQEREVGGGSMTRAQAFNEWMRRYIEEPERFKREWQSIVSFKTAEANGVEPDYGATCDAYLTELMAEV